MIEAIKIQYSDDGMWGATSEGFNVEASYERFNKLVLEKLTVDFPNTEIEIERGNDDFYRSFTNEAGWEDSEMIANVVSKIWQSFDWIVLA